MGFKVSVVTNGHFINNETLKLLYASGVRSISISIDGMNDNHNWLRQNNNSFITGINALSLLKKNGLFYIEAITTINKKNINDLLELEKLFNDIGIDAWRLGKTFPKGRAKNYPELFIDSSELNYLLKFIKSRYKRKNLSISYFEEGYLGNTYEYEVRNHFFKCPAGINLLTILSNGDVTGCAAVSDNFIQGNIFKQNIIDIWEKKFKIFRNRNWMKKGICGKCNLWNKCNGDGFHLWETNQIDPTICNYNLLHKK
jgi:radical SAM protein with 4Fe4S-binding SPASM domain